MVAQGSLSTQTLGQASYLLCSLLPPGKVCGGYLRIRHREGENMYHRPRFRHQGGSHRADSTGDCQEPQERRWNVLSEQIPGWKSEHSASELGQSHCPVWASVSPQSLRAWTERPSQEQFGNVVFRGRLSSDSSGVQCRVSPSESLPQEYRKQRDVCCSCACSSQEL